MKLLSAIAFVTLLAAPAAAEMGNIHGSESRGEPLNATYRAPAVDPATGYTPGYTARAQLKVKKKKIKRSHNSASKSRY
jgi:hypothetical protein